MSHLQLTLKLLRLDGGLIEFINIWGCLKYRGLYMEDAELPAKLFLLEQL